MIKTILAVILFVLVAACAAGTVIFGIGKYRNSRRRTVFLSLLIAFLAIFLIVPFSVHTVEPGQVAVVKVLGKAEYVRTPGTYFDFWLTREYSMFDTTVQQEEIETMCYSSDAQTMDVSLVVQYQIQPDKAIEIANNYGQLAMLQQRVRSVSIDKAKTVLSTKSAMNIIETRATVSPDIESIIKQTVVNDYYVDVVAVVITNIDFSDAFEATVEEKMIAEQQQLKAEFEKKKAIIEAERELEVAKLAAEANIAKAEGDAQAQLLRAQAEANAIKAKSIEVARMLGFTITEKQTDVGVEYEIDFTGKTQQEIDIISQYLRYAAYLEKWNGQLPQFVGDGASILIPAVPAE